MTKRTIRRKYKEALANYIAFVAYYAVKRSSGETKRTRDAFQAQAIGWASR